MDSQTLLLAAAAGAATLGVGAALWALIARRAADAGDRGLAARLAAAERPPPAAAEAFETALIAVGDGPARLIAGEESLASCAARLGAPGGDAAATLAALRRA